LIDESPSEIAKAIFKMPGRFEQETALSEVPAEKIKQVRACLNIYVERRKVCRRMNREFWL